jgi:hypothetical protein
VGVILVATALTLLGITGKASGDDHADFSVGALILFEAAAVGLGLLLILSHRINRIRVQQGVLLDAAAGLGFGISDVAIKAISGDVCRGSGSPSSRQSRRSSRRLAACKSERASR